MASSNISKCTNLCATSTSGSLSDPRLILLSVRFSSVHSRENIFINPLGHNGSKKARFFLKIHVTDAFLVGGKSAVLSAITVALGGKANSTGSRKWIEVIHS